MTSLAAVPLACGGGGGDGDQGAAGNGDGGVDGAGGGGGVMAGDTSSDGGPVTDGAVPEGGGAPGVDAGPASAFGGLFRHGMNSGAINPTWTDDTFGLLGVKAGADSNRIKLPEYFLDQWGVGVRTQAAASYLTNGMSNVVCFLIGPTKAHSTDPSGNNLEAFIPKNLYAPIFGADGAANPDNYWAKYVEETVTTYKPWVHVWEVWNEPDWTPAYATTTAWASRPPVVADLPRFNGSIFDYVRMLRVTTAVAKKVDPTARVALGGLGYPTFFRALLKYTDNPAQGAVTADYPAAGGAYFDVMNFHYYPLYTPGNSDAAVQGLVSLKNQFAAEMTAANVTGKSWNATETGAPRYALGGMPGGDDYAKNYLLKAMTRAQLEGMSGLDWFLLSDGALPGASQTPYDYMGLYLDVAKVASPDSAVKSSLGVAYTTLGKLLKGARADLARTASLALTSNVAGGAFQAANGHTVVVLWATAKDGEAATATYALAASGAVTAYAWDYGTTGASSVIFVANGKATVRLTATPQFFDVH